MKRIIRITLLISFILTASLTLAQTLNPKISFYETEHDFGSIKEEDGKVQTVFEFKNLGQEPLIVRNVTSSCGCTTPSYSREPILPGNSGKITAVFDPSNRPGAFLKHITVYTNADNKPVVLTLKGNVAKRAPTVADKYPYSFDNIRLNKSHVSFLKMDKGEKKTSTVNIINTSEIQPVTIDFTRVPDYIQIKSEPQILQPGESGKIIIDYDASGVDDWGFVLDGIFIKQNGSVDYNHKLSVSVTIQEDFSNLSSDELAQAPKINFEDPNFNFETIKQGEKIEHEFPFVNKGGKNLVIRKVKASCGCTAIKPEKMVIAPGEESSIKIVFDSKGKKGRQYKTVTVITNAPNNPTSVLKIIGTVN